MAACQLRAESAKAEAQARRQIRAGIPYDYGARTSLREAVAAYNTKEHFAEADVIDSFKRLGSRLMDCIETFLMITGSIPQISVTRSSSSTNR